MPRVFPTRLPLVLALCMLAACDAASDEPRTVVEGIAVEAATGAPLENISVSLYDFGSGPASFPIGGIAPEVFAIDTTGSEGRFYIGSDDLKNGEVRVDAVDRRLSGPGYVRYYYTPTNLPQYVPMGRHTKNIRIEFVLVDREAVASNSPGAQRSVGSPSAR